MTGAAGMALLWAFSKLMKQGAITPVTPSGGGTVTPVTPSGGGITPVTPEKPSRGGDYSPWPLPPTPSPVVPVKPATPSMATYRVQSGDTGEKIALKFTGDKGRWPDLKAANPTIMKARKAAAAKYGFPIYVGDTINLPASWAGLAPTASTAAAVANAAMQKAAKNPTPVNMSTAAKATQQAAKVTTATNKQVQTAAKAPKPWPQAKPSGLPPFPSGWEFDTPVRPEVSTRAWQLLPILWARGKGATAVETIKGRWLTFQAQDHGGGKKGVTVYRVKNTGGASGSW